MDLQSLLSIQTIFLSLSIGIITYFIRSIIDVKYPKAQLNPAYGKVFIPLLSCMVGIGICMFSQILPGFFTSTKMVDKIMLGIISGWASSFIFRIFRTFLVKESGGTLDQDGNSIAPPADAHVPANVHAVVPENTEVKIEINSDKK